MLEVGVRFIEPVKAEPDFLAVIFQFCGIGEVTKLGGTVQNFTKWCM